MDLISTIHTKYDLSCLKNRNVITKRPFVHIPGAQIHLRIVTHVISTAYLLQTDDAAAHNLK